MEVIDGKGWLCEGLSRKAFEDVQTVGVIADLTVVV